MPRSDYAPVVKKPLPNARLPLLLAFILAAAMVLVYLFYLRPADKLLGHPIRPNEYEEVLTAPKPKPVVIQPITPAPPPAAPAGTGQ